MPSHFLYTFCLVSGLIFGIILELFGGPGGVLEVILWSPVVFEQKEGYVLNCGVFMGPFWRPTWGPKFTFMLQDALKSPSRGVWEAFF